VRNVRVDNCTFAGTDDGLRFKSARGRGGVVEKIFISNVRMVNLTSDAIDFDMFYENGSPAEESVGVTETNSVPVSEGTPQFRDIHIENLICRGAQDAIVLKGLPEMPIRDIELKDISITAGGGVFLTDAEGIRFQNVRVENKTGPALTQVRVKNSSVDLAP
jgi:DNA sulfur modification protein DndE